MYPVIPLGCSLAIPDLPVFFLDCFADTVYHRLTFTDDEQDCGFKRILSTVLLFGRRYA